MTGKKTDNGKIKYYIERKGGWAQAAMILMLMSAVFRVIGCWGMWTDSYFTATQIVLPICCNLLFALCVLVFGKKGFWLSAIPVLLGVVFFTVKAFGFESWIQTVLCIMLYLLVAVVYTGTVFGVIGTKWLLPPLFGLPLIYHIFVEDLARMQDAANPVALSEGMQEISVLCIMAALLCAGFGIKRHKPEAELPDGKAAADNKATATAAATPAESVPAPATPVESVPAPAAPVETESTAAEKEAAPAPESEQADDKADALV